MTAGRESSAPRIIVWVPPPLAPVTPIRVVSTSGNETRKSSERIELYVCSPITDCALASARGLNSPQFSGVFISGRCLEKP